MPRVMLIGAMLAAPVLAAPVLAHAQPVNGPYVAVGGGVNVRQTLRTQMFFNDGTPIPIANYSFHPGVVGLASLGYGFGRGVRVELEGSYRNNSVATFPNLLAETSHGGQEETYGAMANGLYDFNVGLPWLLPYLGAGVGVQWTHLTQHLSGPPDVFIGGQEFRGGTDARFAYQAILGVAAPLPDGPGLSLTAEYRFLGLAGAHAVRGERVVNNLPEGYSYDQPISIRTNGEGSHSFLIGLRYAFGAPAKPPPPSTAPP